MTRALRGRPGRWIVGCRWIGRLGMKMGRLSRLAVLLAGRAAGLPGPVPGVTPVAASGERDDFPCLLVVRFTIGEAHGTESTSSDVRLDTSGLQELPHVPASGLTAGGSTD
jgi:hypothetical protein